MNINLKIVIPAGVMNMLRRIEQNTRHILRKEDNELAILDDLQAEVEDVVTVQDSAIALIEGLAVQLQEAIANPVAIQAIIDNLKTNKTELADAVSANTPAD